jgi:hypothetical protein
VETNRERVAAPANFPAQAGAVLQAARQGPGGHEKAAAGAVSATAHYSRGVMTSAIDWILGGPG